MDGKITLNPDVLLPERGDILVPQLSGSPLNQNRPDTQTSAFQAL